MWRVGYKLDGREIHGSILSRDEVFSDHPLGRSILSRDEVFSDHPLGGDTTSHSMPTRGRLLSWD